jgi:hypothetical protein
MEWVGEAGCDVGGGTVRRLQAWKAGWWFNKKENGLII